MGETYKRVHGELAFSSVFKGKGTYIWASCWFLQQVVCCRCAKEENSLPRWVAVRGEAFPLTSIDVVGDVAGTDMSTKVSSERRILARDSIGSSWQVVPDLRARGLSERYLGAEYLIGWLFENISLSSLHTFKLRQ